MTTSNHGYRPLARLILAAGGIGAFLAAAAGLYAVDVLIGGLRGLAAGVMLACAVTATCGLVFRVATPRPQFLARPAPVQLPEPAGDCEPATSLT